MKKIFAIILILAMLIPYEGILGIVCKLAICVVIPNGIILLCFIKSTELKEALSRVKGFLKRAKPKKDKEPV